MLSFLFEHRLRVLLSCFSGALTNEDLVNQNRLARAHSARERVAGSIIDFTDVTSVEIDMSLVSNLGREENRKSRVFVVPKPEMFGLARLYSTYNGLNGVAPPTLAKTRQEAFECLLLRSPDFQPFEIEP